MFVFASPEVAHAGIFTDFLADAGNAILSFFGLLVWAAGVLLNYAILANLNIAGFVTDQTGVKAAWTIIRDLANIGFIFILLFIGIAMILRLDGYNTKKLLATLIIAALLVNFSMFFAKVVIDVSNAFALEFYEAVSAPCNGNKDILNCLDNGISDRFMQNLKLTTIFNLEGDTGISGFTKLGNTESGFLDAEEINKGNKTGANIELNAGNIFLITFLGSIFLLITAFVFFAVSILFVIRFIALIILITLSPIGIAAFALPATAQYGSKWWKALFQYSFFAPVYLLFTYIIFKFMDSLTRDFGAEKSMFTAIIKGDSGSVGIIFNFLVITSLMLASLLLARNMSGAVGSKAVGFSNTLRKWGQGAILSRTVGRLGYWLGRGQDRTAIRTADTTERGWIGRRFTGALKVLSPLGKYTGAAKVARKTLQAVEGSKFSGTESFKEGVEYKQRRKKVLDVEKEVIETKGAAKKLAIEPNNEEAIAIIGKSGIKTLEKIDPKLLYHENVAWHLDENQLRAIGKSDEFTDRDTEQILSAHFKTLTNAINNLKANPGNQTLRDNLNKEFKGLSDKEFELFVGKLGSILRTGDAAQDKAIASTIKQSHLSVLKKSNEVNRGTKQFVQDTRKGYLMDVATGTNVAEQDRVFGSMNAVEKSELDTDLFKYPQVTVVSKYVDAATLIELSKKLGAAEKTTIRREVGKRSTDAQRDADDKLRMGTPLQIVF